ncbi:MULTISPECIES: luciferase family protein [unclassified Streptomyces]|uniref:luciferase domain-containing protein n=1 Tax=unclassified Streptomyces TaxID=2593676 RepID=UPI002E18F244
MTAAHRAMTQLESWPNLVSGSPRCAVGRSFGTAGCDIVHFHANDAADLYLTRTAVERLLPQLRDSTAIRVRPGASWITVLLDCDDDVALLLTLISVALKEHDAVRGPEEECGGPRTARTAPPCDWEPLAIPSPRAAGPVAASGGAHHGRVHDAWKAVGRMLPHGH